MKTKLTQKSLFSTIGKVFVEIPEFRKYYTYTLHFIIGYFFSLFFFHFSSFNSYEEDTRFKCPKKVKKMLFHLLPCGGSDKSYENFPCANQVRTIVDRINSSHLKKSISSVWHNIQRSGLYPHLYTYVGVAKSFINLGLVILFDGTGARSSRCISCLNCCTKRHNKGSEQEFIEYHHQSLIAAVVPPKSNYILPIDCEAIEQQDGAEKNDCERNANKRLLPRIAREHRNMPITYISDDLGNNTPNLRILIEHGMNWIMTCNPGSHKATYDAFNAAKSLGESHTYTTARYKYMPNGRKATAQKCKSIFMWVDKVPSRDNDEKDEQNSVDYTLVVEQILNVSTKEVILERGFSTNLEVTEQNVWDIRNVWRKIWKLENNGNNTLKNHGINLEHNYGHGSQYLVANTVILSLLVLLVTNLLLLVNEDDFYRWRAQWNTLIKAVDRLREEIFHWKGDIVLSWEELWARLFFDSS